MPSGSTATFLPAALHGAAGDRIDPANAKVGDRLQARDAPEPYWHDAAVIAKPSRTSVTVRFKNFSSKHDKTLKRADKALRVPVTAAELKAEQAALERTPLLQCTRMSRSVGSAPTMLSTPRWAA